MAAPHDEKREQKEYGRGERKSGEVKRNSLSPTACLRIDRYCLLSDDPRKLLVPIWALITVRCTSAVLFAEARMVRGLGLDGP